jgi:hypothetical protein
MRSNAILSALSVFLAGILLLVISVIIEGFKFSSHPHQTAPEGPRESNAPSGTLAQAAQAAPAPLAQEELQIQVTFPGPGTWYAATRLRRIVAGPASVACGPTTGIFPAIQRRGLCFY